MFIKCSSIYCRGKEYSEVLLVYHGNDDFETLSIRDIMEEKYPLSLEDTFLCANCGQDLTNKVINFFKKYKERINVGRRK